MVPGAGIEPVRFTTQDFKSCASASSATPAYIGAEDGTRTRNPHLGKVILYH